MFNFYTLLIGVSKKVLQLPSYKKKKKKSQHVKAEREVIFSRAVSSLCREVQGVGQGHKGRCRKEGKLELRRPSVTQLLNNKTDKNKKNKIKQNKKTPKLHLWLKITPTRVARNGEQPGPSPAGFRNKAVMNPRDVPVTVTRVRIDCDEKALLLNK